MLKYYENIYSWEDEHIIELRNLSLMYVKKTNGNI